jgi:hypothetical protein
VVLAADRVAVDVGGCAHGGVAEARGDGRKVHAVGQQEAGVAVAQDVEEAPLGRPRRRQSRDTVDDTEFGISGDPSGLAEIRSRSLR